MSEEETQPSNLPDEVIEKCFFVSDGEADESTPEDEILLYFYPRTFPLQKQVLLAGAVNALVHYIADFTDEPVRTLSMNRIKFAVLRLGSYTLVASGPAEEADSVLQNHIQTLYAAYSFYWGPLEHVGHRFKKNERRLFVSCIQNQCKKLVPLLDGFRDKGKLNAFVWLPFSSPPPNTARHFMQASNILSSIQTEQIVYGGCVFFDSSVLCTHMDVEITRWMLNVVELNRDNIEPGKPMRGRLSSTVESRSIFLPVYLTKEQCEKLNLDESHKMSEEGDPMLRMDSEVDDRNTYEDTDAGYYVTLCILFLNNISLALLMSKHADNRAFRLISVKRQLEGRLSTLEKDMSNSSYKGTLRSNSSLVSRDVSDDSLRTPFHYLTTDSLTGMTKGTILKMQSDNLSEREDRFLVGSSYVHEEFFKDNEINKVILGDHCGFFYGRHMFSKEIFYKRFFNSSPSDHLTLDRIEECSQQNLSEGYNINLI